MPRRAPASRRLRTKVSLDRRGWETFQLEARRIADRLGVAVTKISIRRPGRRKATSTP
jgi:hypothetical protein